MMGISTLLDPRYVFLIYAPILFALNRKIGHRMIIALTLAEWANQILKWLLAGERPYWYVHERISEAEETAINSTGINSYDSAIHKLISESNANQRQPLANLRQFPVTCELGAGSPSGHSMVTATVWYVMIDAYLKGQLRFWSAPKGASEATGSNRVLASISWTLYTLMLISVSLSRVYLACHFPHQCLGGALLGLLIAWFVCERLPIERLERTHFCLATVGMFASALGTYAILGSMGFNPLWSVEKATRWCVKKEYIHLDTTPFFSMMRYIGFCFGAGLAFDYNRKEKLVGASQNTAGKRLIAQRLLTAVISILFGQFLFALPAPKVSLNVFYVISFVTYTIFSYAIAAPIPNLIKSTLSSSHQHKSRNDIKVE